MIAVSLEQVIGVFTDPAEADILLAACQALAGDPQQFHTLIEELTQLCLLRNKHA